METHRETQSNTLKAIITVLLLDLLTKLDIPGVESLLEQRSTDKHNQIR